MTDDLEVAVVVGGPAGLTAALRARELGASVALVEGGNPGGCGVKEERSGGKV